MNRFKLRAWDDESQDFIYLAPRTGGYWPHLKLKNDLVYEWEQWTTWRDKNGEMIYEGDYVRRWRTPEVPATRTDKYKEVKWVNDWHKAGWNIGGGKHMLWEIVGNKHEGVRL